LLLLLTRLEQRRQIKIINLKIEIALLAKGVLAGSKVAAQQQEEVAILMLF
jgi:hypothetical protein